MKKIFVLFIVICLSAGTAFAQKTNKKFEFWIISSAVSALYEGCGNDVKIAFSGDVKDAQYTTENATITPGAKRNSVIIVPNSGAKTVTLNVSSGKKLIASQVFVVRRVPSASIAIVGFENVALSVKAPTELSLKVVPDESFAVFLPKEAQYRIESFTVTHARGSKPLGTYTSEGNKVDLSKVVAEDGDILMVQNIVTKRSNFRGEVSEPKINTYYIALNIRP